MEVTEERQEISREHVVARERGRLTQTAVPKATHARKRGFHKAIGWARLRASHAGGGKTGGRAFK